MKRNTEPNCLCQWCGGAFRVPPCRLETAKYCSPKCRGASLGKATQKRVSLVCPACGNGFEVPECHVDRRKYCSLDCRNGDAGYRALKSDVSRGALNATWKGGRVSQSDGYIYRSVGKFHPFSCAGYMLEHRFLMERHLVVNDPESQFLVRLGNHLYLSPDFQVHHVDEEKKNNSISNLVCMTPSEHKKLHNDQRREKSQTARGRLSV